MPDTRSPPGSLDSDDELVLAGREQVSTELDFIYLVVSGLALLGVTLAAVALAFDFGMRVRPALAPDLAAALRAWVCLSMFLAPLLHVGGLLRLLGEEHPSPHMYLFCGFCLSGIATAAAVGVLAVWVSQWT